MGSATSVPAVNKLSTKTILNGKSKEDVTKFLTGIIIYTFIIKATLEIFPTEFDEKEAPVFELIRIGFQFVVDNKGFLLEAGPTRIV